MPSPVLLFDLDGTLVDTAPDLLGAVNAVLLDERRPPIGQPLLRHMVGHGARALIEQAMAITGEQARPEHLPQLVERFISHYRDHLVDGSRAFPGVEATLAQLRCGGARLAVLTNKPQVLTLPILKALRLDHFFDAICGTSVCGFHKPDARVVGHVLDELGGAPDGCIMIGDGAVDVATARAANIPVILLSYGYTPETAHRLGADLVLDSFPELPAALLKFQ